MSRNDDSRTRSSDFSGFLFCRMLRLVHIASKQLIRNSEMGKLLLQIPEAIGDERRVDLFFLGEGENRFSSNRLRSRKVFHRSEGSNSSAKGLGLGYGIFWGMRGPTCRRRI